MAHEQLSFYRERASASISLLRPGAKEKGDRRRITVRRLSHLKSNFLPERRFGPDYINEHYNMIPEF